MTKFGKFVDGQWWVMPANQWDWLNGTIPQAGNDNNGLAALAGYDGGK